VLPAVEVLSSKAALLCASVKGVCVVCLGDIVGLSWWVRFPCFRSGSVCFVVSVFIQFSIN
jgi:hypothetical protein